MSQSVTQGDVRLCYYDRRPLFHAEERQRCESRPAASETITGEDPLCGFSGADTSETPSVVTVLSSAAANGDRSGKKTSSL